MNLEKIIQQKKGTMIDVRTPEEFMGGNVAGAVNIPLNEMAQRMKELKQYNAPLLLCCATGNRSGMAQKYLSQFGIECYNAGSWLDLNFIVAQSETTINGD